MDYQEVNFLKSKVEEHDREISELKIQAKDIQEIKKMVELISAALTGNVANESIGLIEKNRATRKDVEELKADNLNNKIQLNDLMNFKKEVKKIVAAIAFTIPILFEIIKGTAILLWSLFKSHL